MNVKESMNLIKMHVREGENCSCPYLKHSEKTDDLAVFTFLAYESEFGLCVYGFGQEIVCTADGQVHDVWNNRLLNTSDLIRINDDQKVSVEERTRLYEDYYAALQKYFDSEQNPKSVPEIRNIFEKLVSSDARKMFKLVCPEFLDFMTLE